MSAAGSITIASQAWADRADELAAWAHTRLVNRPDVWGQYLPISRRTSKKQQDGKTRHDTAITAKGKLTKAILATHFAGADLGDLVGLHSTSLDNMALWLGIDIDWHQGDPVELKAANLNAAMHWYATLREHGFDPLLTESNGLGGYQLRVLFCEPIKSSTAYNLAQWIVSDYEEIGLKKKPETFPKQPELTSAKMFGNWLRLPGRHHSHEHWTRVWDGIAWLDGYEATDAILSHGGDDPSLIKPLPITAVHRALGDDVRPPNPGSRQSLADADRARQLSEDEVIHRCLDALGNDYVDDYQRWIEVGMILRDAGLPVSVWDVWSRHSPKYVDGECEKKWSGFGRNGGRKRTVATLVKWARDCGVDVYARTHPAAVGPAHSTNGKGKQNPPPPPENRAAVPDVEEDWGDQIPLDQAMAPPMPRGIFAGWLGDMIDGVSLATETPPELAASFGLAALSTVCAKRFSVHVKGTHFEPLNIWTCAALESGNRKTASFLMMNKPIVELEKIVRSEAEPKIKQAVSERKTMELRISWLRDQCKKLDDAAAFAQKKDEIAELEKNLPSVPESPRMFTDDVTSEHLATMLAANEERIALLSDEGGIFDTIGGRYSNGVANMEIYLKGHAGSPVRVDRGSRPSVFLEHPAITFGISPQPGVLRKLSERPEFRDRGFLARYLWWLPRSKLGFRKNQTVAVPDRVVRAYREAVFSLGRIPPRIINDKTAPYVLTLCPEALAAWEAFWEANEQRMQPGGKLFELKDWGSKLPGAVARIAGLLHCADYASCVDTLEIQVEAIGRAIALGNLLTEHAIIMFDVMVGSAAKEIARRLWSEIEKNRQPIFSARDAWHPTRKKYPRSQDVAPGFDLLIDHNYIMPVDPSEKRGVGRPSRKFIVNPKIAEDWK